MSWIVSPRPSCSSADDRTTAWAPSCSTPTSNDTRVRVDGFSKIRAIDRPASACACAARSAFRVAGEVEEVGELGRGEVVDAQVVTHAPESSGTSDRGCRGAQARSSAPNSARDRSTMAASAGSTSSSVRVRSGARNSSANARLLRPSGIDPASEDVEQRRSVQELPAGGLHGRLRALRPARRPAPRTRDLAGPAGTEGPRRVGTAGRPRTAEASSSISATATRPSMLERPRDPRMELPQDADRLVPEEDARRPSRVERRRRGARRATTRPTSAPSPRRAPRAIPRASSTSNARSSAAQPSPAAPHRTKPDVPPLLDRVRPARRRCRPRRSRRTPNPSAGSSRPCGADPGRRRVRSHASSARSGFASGIASSSPIRARSSSEANGKRLGLAEPGADERVADPARERVPVGQTTRLRRSRDGGTDTLVPLDPHDLFDQVDLALDVGPVARDLDLDDVGRPRGGSSGARRTRRRHPTGPTG